MSLVAGAELHRAIIRVVKVAFIANMQTKLGSRLTLCHPIQKNQANVSLGSGHPANI